MPYPTLSKPDYQGLPILSYETHHVEKRAFALIYCDERTKKKAHLHAQSIAQDGFSVRILRRATLTEERKDNEFKPFWLSNYDCERGEGPKNLITLEEYFQNLARARALIMSVRNFDNSLTQMIEECKVYRVRLLIDELTRLKGKMFDLGNRAIIFGANEEVIGPLKAALWEAQQESIQNGELDGVEPGSIKRFEEFKGMLEERIMECIMGLEK